MNSESTSKMIGPMVTFNNGKTFPIFGLGTWQSKKEEVQRSVRAALDLGYRHIDTAEAYGNEADIGEVLQEYFKADKLKREDIFITTKLSIKYHQPERVVECLNKSLAELQLDYVDLYLIHYPCAFEDIGIEMFTTRPDGTPAYLNIPIETTWKAMELMVDAGKTKSIGISNFNSKQVERILKIGKIKPVVNQVECHAYFNQSRLHEFCKQREIYITSYGSLGSPGRPHILKTDGESVLLDDPLIKQLAQKYNKTSGQILLRYNIDRNIMIIPKSINPDRIQENSRIFDFKLMSEEVKQIDGLDKGRRYFTITLAKEHPEYPGNELF